MKHILEKVVVDFYTKATTDILIGYHFRKIQKGESKDPLYPSLHQFSSHIPRIIKFWGQQLGRELPPSVKGHNVKNDQFDILKVHRNLFIRKGELNRWLLLFRQTLSEVKELYPDELEFIEKWQQKIDHFEIIFNEKLF